MTEIVESRGADTPVQNIGPFGDSSVGRGRSDSSKRKAGDALLGVGKGMPSRDAVKGTILEYVPVGGAGLQFF